MRWRAGRARQYYETERELRGHQFRARRFSNCWRLRNSTALGGWSRHRHLQFSISPANFAAGGFAMKTWTRLAIVGACAVLCAAGIYIAHSDSEKIARDEVNVESMDAIVSADGYQFAA